ncbi:hypothetical protein BWI17_14775 [Betaproteobacteria bacterium GR16-43]|nr:hypothetical protein BWI17_14775 [Betaproteobacteria bacterium GR16-43]
MTWLRKHPLFLLIVVVPTALALLYFGLIASDTYVSESRFVIRSPQRQSSAGLMGALLQGSAFSRAQDDSYSVHDFMLSRDALHELDEKLGVIKAYSDAGDFVGRFPGLDWDRSFEAFHRYWQKKATVDFDPNSSITVLRVRAFKAADAQKINDMLLTMGERLVNQLNERSRRDLVSFADREVKLAEDKVKDAALAMSSFRGRQAVYEPDRQAALQLQGVAKIQEELLATETQIAQLRRLSPSNPQIPGLISKAETLRGAIAAENAKVTGSGSLSARAPDFQKLALEKEFADRQLATALAASETARSEALRKQLYLERLVRPNLPDESVEPRRLRLIFTVFVLSLAAWGVVSLLVASVREHAD